MGECAETYGVFPWCDMCFYSLVARQATFIAVDVHIWQNRSSSRHGPSGIRMHIRFLGGV